MKTRKIINQNISNLAEREQPT